MIFTRSYEDDMRILHITVHLGGGIGTVLVNWMKRDFENEHTIVCLNRNYYVKYDSTHIYENMHRDSRLLTWIEESDVVVIHFWNHPLLFDFLINTRLPRSRICFWAHISGLNAPYVFSEKLISFSDRFVFSSPISYRAEEVRRLPKILTEKLRTIWTTGDIEEYTRISRIEHDTFNVGCVGTLDYSKLHPNFVDMCSKIASLCEKVRFIVCGGGCDAKKIEQQVRERKLENRFLFTGVIKDVRSYLAIIDVFGYPLNPKHFGTCEQVLGEAMAAGIIPIVMKNPAEEYILFETLKQFTCNSEEEYIDLISSLYHRKERLDIVSLIQQRSTELYDIRNMINSWAIVFRDLMREEKDERIWPVLDENTKKQGYRVFIESLGDYGKVLEKGSIDEISDLFNSNEQWKSKSKGSVLQYLEIFPEDEQLQKWANLVR